eukprot:gnl/MRDRNA2_/MRDRNA2_69954_c0_seq2.p1 gnl/MRDRNA2_/MRDRNA2_69954_c0~~gnl/MRDRNA2_/MRDRNA2_69954_c0_seq2.p1  ORF type:complete len:339 (+),score=50.60 gnl/MRDRNA2_/MRDRNA2_69954_c0_seq2:111-1127(+)
MWWQKDSPTSKEWPVETGTGLAAEVNLHFPKQFIRVVLLEISGAPLTVTPFPDPLASLVMNMPSRSNLPVQNYHYTMIADTARNRAYREAIEFTITMLSRRLGRRPLVLDLGAGTGLLGMFAARAGADVWAVEMNPILQAVCAECVAANSNKLKGNMTVLPPMVSTQIRVGKELPEKVDLVVSEVLDADLIAEGVIVSLRHAKQQLLKPGGLLLPYKASVYLAPTECEPIGSAALPLDFSALNEEYCRGYMPFRFDTMPMQLLASYRKVLEIDFRSLPTPKPGAPIMAQSPQLGGGPRSLFVEKAGRLDGYAYYFDVHLVEAQFETEELLLCAGPGCK